MNTQRHMPSPALVVSVVALLIAGYGTAWAVQANSVSSRHIADGQVKTADLGRNAVKTAKLADGAAVRSKIGRRAVRAVALAAGAVTSAKVADGSLKGADIAGGSIAGSRLEAFSADGRVIAGDAIGGSEVSNGSLSGADVLDDSIVNGNLATGAVNSSKVPDNALTGADISETSLGSPLIRNVTQHTQASANSLNATKTVEVSCPAGKVVIGGGAHVDPVNGVGLFQSYPVTSTTWRAFGADYGSASSSWRVHAFAICANI